MSFLSKFQSIPVRKMDLPLRIGILGTASVSKYALIDTCKMNPEAAIVAVASRNGSRAESYGKKYGIPSVYSSYEELISDPNIDAIYNPLPNSLHCEWTIHALNQ